MGGVLVLYDSHKGHTAQMAFHVAEGARSVDGTEVRLKKIDEADGDDLRWCDGLIVGSPTNMGLMSHRLKRFFDECRVWGELDGKLGAAFSSSGGFGGGSELTCLSLLILLMNFGLLVFGVTDYVAPGHTLHYGAIAVGAPDSPNDRAACRLLGTRMAEYVRHGHPTCDKPGE